MRTSSVAFSEENVGEGRDEREESYAGLATLGGARLLARRLTTDVVALKSTLCGKRNEKSRDKVVEGK